MGSRRDCTWILGLSGFRVVSMDEGESAQATPDPVSTLRHPHRTRRVRDSEGARHPTVATANRRRLSVDADQRRGRPPRRHPSTYSAIHEAARQDLDIAGDAVRRTTRA